VIHVENGQETERTIMAELYQELLAAGELEFTLFGVYRSVRSKKAARH
jgi:hypothetical protein